MLLGFILTETQVTALHYHIPVVNGFTKPPLIQAIFIDLLQYYVLSYLAGYETRGYAKCSQTLIDLLLRYKKWHPIMLIKPYLTYVNDTRRAATVNNVNDTGRAATGNNHICSEVGNHDSQITNVLTVAHS
jgi:hypothetical protein